VYIQPYASSLCSANGGACYVFALCVCSYFLSLALTPSAMIGLDSNLRAPKVELTCNCKPSTYAYPPPVTTGGGKLGHLGLP
jgi:hypothetical protein